MADSERQFGNRNRDFDRDRQREPRLDDRTSYGPRGTRGYSADPAYQGARDYGRDDDRGSTYGGFEERSFADDGDPYGYDRPAYRSQSAREYQTNRANPPIRPNYDSGGYGGRQRSHRGSQRESYGFTPYSDYDGGVSSQFGFGQWDDERQARERWESGRGQERGFFERVGQRVAAWFHDDDKRGQHSGRGPKGYKRSDDRIREDVSDRLADDSWLDATDVEVIVAESEVTLVGTVPSRDAKRRAEHLADAIAGVKHVQNNLRVSQLNQDVPDAGTVIESEASGIATSTLDKQAAGRA